jgi:hypothetical protein
VDDKRARLTWTVELLAERVGIRARLFARIYARNVDRAWPSFVEWAKAQTHPASSSERAPT